MTLTDPKNTTVRSGERSSVSASPRGALLLNLGTPDSCKTQDVRDYLKVFLMDPWVIDIPFIFRWILIHGIILPKRPQKSAEAYRKIWTERGSPLAFHLEDLKEKVREKIGPRWEVKSAMRYCNPSIEQAFREFRELGIQELTVFPLYPQYSLAATESSVRECIRVASEMIPKVQLNFVPAFYGDSGFIQSFESRIRESLSQFQADHFLFSFHGLPERQLRKATKLHAQRPDQTCYRAHSYVTARLIAQRLGLSQAQYTVSFQSRLGRTPWIKPFTDELLRELPKKGVKRLLVICPAFVADCLETLEEIEIRGREDFIQNGGEDLRLVPSLNSSDAWVKAVIDLLENSRKSGDSDISGATQAAMATYQSMECKSLCKI